MAYAPDDEDVLAAEEDEANAGRADRNQDLKPAIGRSAVAKSGALGGGRVAESAGEEEEDANDDDDDETPVRCLPAASCSSWPPSGR